MRMKFRDGFIEVRLSKPETDLVSRTLDMLTSVSKMNPMRKDVSTKVDSAAESLAIVLKILGCDAEKSLLLFELCEKNTGSQ